MEQSALSAHPKVHSMQLAHYTDEMEEIFLKNSEGLELSHRETRFSLAASAIAQDSAQNSNGNEESEAYGEDRFSHRFGDLKAKDLGKRVGQRACEALDGRSIASGQYPVILENLAACDFLEFLAPSFSAETVQKKTSFLTGKIDQKIFSEKITLVDNATLAHGSGSAPFDGEGTPSQENILVKAGFLQGYLYDTYTAQKAKKSSTGNAIRDGLDQLPYIDSTNFYIKPGCRSLEEMKKELPQGLLIRELMGLHTANFITGDFSFGACGFLLKNGQTDHAIRDFTLSGNIFEVLNQIVEVGNNLTFSGSYGAPCLLLENQLIAGG